MARMGGDGIAAEYVTKISILHFLLLVVLPLRLTAGAAAEASEGLSTMRNDSDQTCALRIVSYLRRVITERANVEQREVWARAEYNEEKGIVSEENDKQRKPRPDTAVRVASALGAYEEIAAELDRFDASTSRIFHDIPRLCIAEVAASYSSNESNRDGIVYTVLPILRGERMDAFLMHLQLSWETLRGVYLFVIEGYKPYVGMYNDLVSRYSKIAVNVEKEIEMLLEEEGKSEMRIEEIIVFYARLALLQVKVQTYFAAPYVVLLCIVFFLLLFAPFILSSLLLSIYLYRIWLRLFVLHHIFGISTDEVVLSLRGYVYLIVNLDWSELTARLVVTYQLLTLGGGSDTFLNGLFVVGTIFATFVSVFILILAWVKMPLVLLGVSHSNG
ncbi:hypothetical protein TRVL_05877 [Trypanosoma vivax]|nr:hypothetical protein TRVL_05877 [Trypanosoma vivax]